MKRWLLRIAVVLSVLAVLAVGGWYVRRHVVRRGLNRKIEAYRVAWNNCSAIAGPRGRPSIFWEAEERTERELTAYVLEYAIVADLKGEAVSDRWSAYFRIKLMDVVKQIEAERSGAASSPNPPHSPAAPGQPADGEKE